MPTTPAAETAASAAEAAAAESAIWAGVAERWTRDGNQGIWEDLPGAEAGVIPEVNPRGDLERRARQWGYLLEEGDLGDVALFAAGLAMAEAEAWESGDGVLATQAFEERRFLAAERIVPWAVPWLLAVARCFPEARSDATDTAERLLEIGERHRLAPVLSGEEGIFLPGHDGYGSADQPGELADRIGSLWGGMVVFRRSLVSISGEELTARRPRDRWMGDADFRSNISSWYEVGAVRWRRLAERHPGTSRYWLDLARRAVLTAEIAK